MRSRVDSGGGLLFFGYLTSAAYPHAALPLLWKLDCSDTAPRVDLEDAGGGLIVVVGHPDVNDSAFPLFLCPRSSQARPRGAVPRFG